MTHQAYEQAIAELDALGENVSAALAQLQRAHAPETDSYPDAEVKRWQERKEAARERFTKAEVAEIRGQAAAQLRQTRLEATAAYQVAIERAEQAAAAVEGYAEVLRPEWATMPARDIDYPKAMLRLADDTAASACYRRLTGADWQKVAAAYDDARELGDTTAQRVVEEFFSPTGTQLELARPGVEDVVALYHLLGTIRQARRERHPDAVRQLRDLVATAKTDPAAKLTDERQRMPEPIRVAA